MLNKTVLVSLVLFLAAVLVAPALAGDTKDEALQLSGEVVAISQADGTLTVRGNDEASTTFKVEASTKITREGKSIKLSELAAGDKVAVTYEKQAQSNVAVMIGVMASGKA